MVRPIKVCVDKIGWVPGKVSLKAKEMPLIKEIVRAKWYFWDFLHFNHLETNLKSVSHILGSVPIKACHIPMNLQSEDMCCLCLGLIFQTSQSKLVTSQWICEIRKPLRYVFTACIVNDHRWQLQSIHFVSKSCDLHCQKRTPWRCSSPDLGEVTQTPDGLSNY